MASSKTTTRLKLSQYTATDHPSYVSDYNSDMRKIDDYATSTDTAMSSLASSQALERAVARISALESALAQLRTTVNAIPGTYMPLNPPASAFDAPSQH